jgi:hypothetical protein
MKQGRKAVEEVNRQEGASPCSRKVSGEANPRKPGFHGRMRWKGKNPRRAAVGLSGGGRFRSNSEGESKFGGA